jgi:hypothetical protein
MLDKELKKSSKENTGDKQKVIAEIKRTNFSSTNHYKLLIDLTAG